MCEGFRNIDDKLEARKTVASNNKEHWQNIKLYIYKYEDIWIILFHSSVYST